jgi:hypothetical protein
MLHLYDADHGVVASPPATVDPLYDAQPMGSFAFAR